MFKKIPRLLAVVGMSLSADFSMAQPSGVTSAPVATPAPTRAEGMVMLDYEVVPIPGNASIDLMGFHFLNRMNDWLYLGIGGYAPLVKGEYGGFMALDVTAHAQRKIFGNVFADAGLSLGGGGGGKSTEQSKILSGTGGFFKTYLGLGYDFTDYSIGVNVARIKFVNSAIAHSQVNVYAQIPFSYTIGSYASSGEKFYSADRPADAGATADSGETLLTLGLDNYFQIKPQGTNKNTINAIDLQFSRFMSNNNYWFATAGVGYHGMPLYNQVLAGVGHRFPASSRLNLYSQLGIGSGGFAPEKIDTGPGLLIYPKLAAEYMFDKNLGLSLSAGYLFAPKGSSKNYTLGASLIYHLRSGESGSAAAGDSASSATYKGYRINVFQQTEFRVKDRAVARDNIKMISAQLDTSVNDHVYIPVQVSVAYNAYLGYPGYGELLAGVGVENKYDKDGRLQVFGQVLGGANSHGTILKYGLGLNLGLSDQLAFYGLAGQTFATRKGEFNAGYVGLGLSYRFSVPGR